MAGSQWRSAGSFQAADSSGRRYTVQVESEWHNVGTAHGDGRAVWQDSQFKRHRLPDGAPVNALADGTYQVVATGAVLRRV